MLNEKLDLVSEGFGLSKAQRQLLLRVLWVLGVTTCLAYILGALTIIGISAPYAKAAEVEQLQRTVEVSARIQLAQEIRLQVRIRCTITDQQSRDSLQRAIDSLQDEYARITKGQRYPEPICGGGG